MGRGTVNGLGQGLHGDLTIIMSDVLAVPPESWGEGVRVHECR